MQYIADSNGYLLEVSFGAEIVCGGINCTEYAGSVPAGYDSLEAWYLAEDGKLYRWKVVDGELTLDSSATAPSSCFPLVSLTPDTKARIYSQTDDYGAAALSTISSYPTKAGVYRVGTQVAGLPSGGNGYGVLVIWDGGSYAFHLYRDSASTLYTAKNNTSNNEVQKPSTWSKHTGTSVNAQT